MGFWKSVRTNGFWTTLKIIDSKEFRAECFEAAREIHFVSKGLAQKLETNFNEILQQMGHIVRERYDYSPEVLGAIDEIFEYEDNPIYTAECRQNWEDFIERGESFAAVIDKANKSDPARRTQGIMNMLRSIYGLPENEDEDQGEAAYGDRYGSHCTVARAIC